MPKKKEVTESTRAKVAEMPKEQAHYLCVYLQDGVWHSHPLKQDKEAAIRDSYQHPSSPSKKLVTIMLPRPKEV